MGASRFTPSARRSSCDALREDLRRGPSHALIEEVAEAEADLLQEFASDFSIEYDR